MPFTNFSELDRKKLHAVMPKRLKKPTHARMISHLERVDLFLDDVEKILIYESNPLIEKSPLSRVEARDQYTKIGMLSHQLRLALDRLPERNALTIWSSVGANILFSKMPFPNEHRQIVASEFYPMMTRLLEILELSCDSQVGKKIQRGPDKHDEYALLTRILFAFESLIGPASSSVNGSFYKFIQELSNQVGEQFGTDLIKRCVAEWSNK